MPAASRDQAKLRPVRTVLAPSSSVCLATVSYSSLPHDPRLNPILQNLPRIFSTGRPSSILTGKLDAHSAAIKERTSKRRLCTSHGGGGGECQESAAARSVPARLERDMRVRAIFLSVTTMHL